MVGGLLALLSVGLAFALLRPSPDSVSRPPVTTVEDVAAASADEPDLPSSSPPQTFVLPDRLDIPSELAGLAAVRQPLVLIGQNQVGQVIALDLATGRVSELDPISGQRFKPRVASAERLAGFRVFLGETITLGPDGTVRSMPMTEMDLPIVFTSADGGGFVVHETTTDSVWLLSDADIEPQRWPLPPDVEVRAAVEAGLIVRTRDGVDRRFDPLSETVGAPLTGSVLAIGRDRYITLDCADARCATSVRSLADDAIIALLAVDLGPRNRPVVSPSGRQLAYVDGGQLSILDLDTGADVVALRDAGSAQFTWAPDDTIVYWQSDPETATRLGGLRVFLFHAEGGAGSIELPPTIFDLSQPIHAVRSPG